MKRDTTRVRKRKLCDNCLGVHSEFYVRFSYTHIPLSLKCGPKTQRNGHTENLGLALSRTTIARPQLALRGDEDLRHPPAETSFRQCTTGEIGSAYTTLPGTHMDMHCHTT